MYKRQIVQRAIEAGALDHLPKRRDPLLDANNCNKNYRHVVASIASFSAQLAHRCRNAFPRIFVQLDLHAVPHPLTGLRELASLHLIFDRNLDAADSGQAWIDCFKAIAAHLVANTKVIRNWLNNFDTMVKALTLAHVVPRAIDGAVCGNVIARIAGLTESSATATRWIARSINLKCANKAEMYVWSTLFDELCAELETDMLDEEPSLSLIHI